MPGASWRHPEGPGSTLAGKDLHPVVHVGLEDALAYAAWAGKRLPAEPEWEHAARGGLDGATYAWGEEFMPRGRIMANTWHGRFPCQNLAPHGFTRTSPVKKFRANGYGLYDVTGNVWEWTATPWAQRHSAEEPGAGQHGQQLTEAACCAPHTTLSEHDRFVIKGGSHLCAPSYCHPVPSRRPPGTRPPRHHQPRRLPLRPITLRGTGRTPRCSYRRLCITRWAFAAAAIWPACCAHCGDTPGGSGDPRETGRAHR